MGSPSPLGLRDWARFCALSVFFGSSGVRARGCCLDAADRRLVVKRGYLPIPRRPPRGECRPSPADHRLASFRAKPRPRAQDRLVLALAAPVFGPVLKAITIVRPETFVRWHRSFWRLLWRNEVSTVWRVFVRWSNSTSTSTTRRCHIQRSVGRHLTRSSLGPAPKCPTHWGSRRAMHGPVP